MSHAVLFAHVLSAFVLVSGVVLAAAGQELARRRTLPSEVALVLRLSRTGALLAMGGTVGVVLMGVWLVDLRAWDFGDGWISGALGLLGVATVLASAGGRRPKRARLLATRLAGEGNHPSPDLQALLNDPVSLVVNYASGAILLAVLALMIWKP
jgi:uncharacterized membrane protein